VRLYFPPLSIYRSALVPREFFSFPMLRPSCLLCFAYPSPVPLTNASSFCTVFLVTHSRQDVLCILWESTATDYSPSTLFLIALLAVCHLFSLQAQTTTCISPPLLLLRCSHRSPVLDVFIIDPMASWDLRAIPSWRQSRDHAPLPPSCPPLPPLFRPFLFFFVKSTMFV